MSIALKALWLSAAVAQAGTQQTAFRVTDMDLRDPHVHVNLLGCRDLTDVAFAGFSVNGQLQAQIQGDSDGDGLLDLSSLLLFDPLDQSQSGNVFDYGSADCSVPLASTACSQFVSAGNGALAGMAALQSAGLCLEPLPGTTFGYTPPLASAQAACFLSPAGALLLDLGGGTTVPLQGAQIAAHFDGSPATTLSNGILTGFITEADANATLLPSDLPLIGGMPLASLLPGGAGNCAAHSDKDTRNGQPGWWFYLNFSAVQVPLAVSPSDQLFGDGFELIPP